MVVGKIVRIRNTTKRGITFFFQGTSPTGLHAHIGDQEVEEMQLEANCDFSSDIIIPWLGYGSVYLGESKDSKLGVYMSIGPSPVDRWNNYLLFQNATGKVVCSFKIGQRGFAFMDYVSVGLSLTVEGPEGKEMAIRVSPTIIEESRESSAISGQSCLDRGKPKVKGQNSPEADALKETQKEDVEESKAAVTNGDNAASTNDAATPPVAPASVAAAAVVVGGKEESRTLEPQNVYTPQGRNEDYEDSQNKGGKGKSKNKKGGGKGGGGNKKGSGKGKGGGGGKGGYNQNWSGGGW